MAINCANCNRQYDATLFQFGKTINCACGERVGAEHRIVLPPAIELRFFADVMTHKLVRWLRALGIDTIWEDSIADADLVRRALAEHRWILTLDKRLPGEWRVGNVLLLESEETLAQLREVIAHFKIQMTDRIFSRCLVCNGELRAATETEILAAQLPPDVRSAQTNFRFCPTCCKVYWNGSHTARMKKTLNEIFKQ